MSESEPDIDRFVNDVRKTISYYSKEYSLKIAEVVGALELIKLEVIEESVDDG